MKRFLCLVLGLAALILTAAEAGKPCPPLRVAKWYFRSQIPAGPLECTVLFDAAGAKARDVLRMLEALQEEFRIPIRTSEGICSGRQNWPCFIPARSDMRMI